MRIQVEQLALNDEDLIQMIALVGSDRPDVTVKTARFEPEGLCVEGTVKTPLGALGFEKTWKVELRDPGCVLVLGSLKLGKSFPIPFLKSMMLEQVKALLEPWEGIEVKGEEIRIDYRHALRARGIDLVGSIRSLQLEKGGCQVGF